MTTSQHRATGRSGGGRYSNVVRQIAGDRSSPSKAGGNEARSVKIVQNRYLWGAAAAVAATGTIMVGASAASADNLQQNDLSAVPATHTVNVGDLDATRYQLTA